MINLTIHTTKALDTGIGHAHGYKSDADLVAHAEQERAALDPGTRALLERLDAQTTHAMLFGQGAKAR